MHCPNHVLVTIESKFDDKIVFEDGTVLYKAAELDLNWNVTVTGIVSATCQKVNLKSGDEIAFSYQVIAAKKWSDSDEVFQIASEKSNEFTEYIDGKGRRLRKIKSYFYRKWDGILLNKDFTPISFRLGGSESEVDRWLSQFKFSDSKGTFKNCIDFHEQEYWKVTIPNIIAKKEGEEIKMMGSELLCEPLLQDITKTMEIAEGIVLPEGYAKLKYDNTGVLTHDYEALGLKTGDILSFEEKYGAKYKLWGKDYVIVKKDRVLGKFN